MFCDWSYCWSRWTQVSFDTPVRLQILTINRHHRKKLCSVDCSLPNFYEPEDPLVFNVIYVNEGNQWNEANNTVTTYLHAGIYLIDIRLIYALAVFVYGFFVRG